LALHWHHQHLLWRSSIRIIDHHHDWLHLWLDQRLLLLLLVQKWLRIVRIMSYLVAVMLDLSIELLRS
jgi:hypothetical protein